MFTRQKYQRGSLRKVKRKKGPPVWEFRFRDSSAVGRPLRQMTFGTKEFPNEADARQHVEALVWKLNSGTPAVHCEELTFGALCDLFISDEHLEEIGRLKPGQPNSFALKVSTARSYLQMINNHIRPQWGTTPMSKVKAARVQDWLRGLQRSPLTKAHIKALMSRLFNKAMLWELLEVTVNPMSLVEVRGVSKRRKKPLILTIQQCADLRSQLREPYRTMVLIAQCTGLRTSEILSLQWKDVDFENLSMKVDRSVVRGIVDRVKTECSQDEIPLDSAFATELLNWKTKCPPASHEAWIFPSPVTRRPYEPGSVQQHHIRPAGQKLGLPNVGWHTFRHTYRSLLDSAGAPVGVQTKLMRHANVSTAMDWYGGAQMAAKREANGKVVQMMIGA